MTNDQIKRVGELAKMAIEQIAEELDNGTVDVERMLCRWSFAGGHLFRTCGTFTRRIGMTKFEALCFKLFLLLATTLFLFLVLVCEHPEMNPFRAGP